MVTKDYIADKPMQIDTNTKVTDILTKTNAINTDIATLLNGRVVKSVQRGLASMVGSSMTVSISVVDIEKSMVLFDNFYTATSATNIPSYPIYLNDFTSNSLTFACGISISNPQAKINWQVIEFY